MNEFNSYFQVRRYPFVNDDEQLNAIADNTLQTTEIEEKIRKVNEALDKEIEKEEEQIVQELFKDEYVLENVLNEITQIENELILEALEEDFEVEEFDLSSFVNSRNVPLDVIFIGDEPPISQVDFGLIQEIE